MARNHPLTVIITLLILSFSLSRTPLFARVIQVPDDQRTIQNAIDVANQTDTILVHPGEYECYTINDHGIAAVVGDFFFTGDEEAISQTILTGRAGDKAIHFEGFTYVCGITFEDGIGSGANDCIRFTNAIVENSRFVQIRPGGEGQIAIYTDGSIFRDCLFGENGLADLNVANAYWMMGSDFSFIGCQFSQNSGIATVNHGEFYGCAFKGNASRIGGAVDSHWNRYRFCTFTDNHATQLGGAVHGDADSYYCCTFSENSAQHGSALYLTGGISELENCIIWGNNQQGIHLGSAVSLNISYSDIRGGQNCLTNEDNNNPGHCTWGDGNFDTDPLFVDPEDSDFHLTGDSPCIDVGDPNSPIDPDQTRADIGAFYFAQRAVIAVTPDSLDFGSVMVGANRQLALRFSNAGNEPLTITAVETDNEAFQAILNAEVTLQEGEAFDLPVTFTPAAYEPVAALLTITSNDFQNQHLTIPLSGSGAEDLPAIRHFTGFTETDVNHSLLIEGLTFEGEPVPSGWEIAVFTPGGLLCGANVWSAREGRIGVAAWGDDVATENVVEGFRAGEYFCFRVWDDQNDIEYPAVAGIEEGPCNWRINGMTALSVDAMGMRHQTISLVEGWNMISLNVIPPDSFWTREEGPDIIRMTERLRVNQDLHRIVLMKDDDGRFYYPAIGFNNIPYWDLTRGYQIKALSDVDVEWTGDPIAPYADIPLRNGWNIIAYYPFYSLDAGAPALYALSPILDHVILAKDDHGRFMWPVRQFSNMVSWTAGQGYQVDVDQDIVLNYPNQQNRRDAVSPEEPQETLPSHFVTMNTGKNMSILIKGADSGEIKAFTQAGLCIGASLCEGNKMVGLAVWGDDPTTQQVDGAIEGEALSYHFWDGSAESVVETKFLEGDGRYTTNGFAQMNITGLISQPLTWNLAEAFPNPFNSSTTIRFSLREDSKARLVVYDLSGREVATLVSGDLKAGSHSAVWNGEGFSSGIYLVKMETPNFGVTKKVTLLK